VESKIFKAPPKLLRRKISASTIRGGDSKSIVGSLNQTNQILVEIQNQLALDFANRIAEDKKENAALRAARDKRKRVEAESNVEATKESGKLRGLLGRNLEKVIQPAKNIFGGILKFLKGLTLAFVVDKVLKWFGNEENRKKLDTAFTWIQKNGESILKLAGGVVLGRLILKLLKVASAIKRVTKSLRIFSRFGNLLRRIPLVGKLFPKGGKGFGRFKFPGGKLFGAFGSAFNVINRLAEGQTVEQAFAGAAAGLAGFMTGAKAGGVAGAMVGSIFPGPGTAIGGVLGSLVGGILGAYGAEKLVDSMTGVEGYNKGGVVTGNNVGNKDSVTINATVGERIFDRDTSNQRFAVFDDFQRGGPQYDAAIKSLHKSNRMLASITGGNKPPGSFTVPAPSNPNVRSVPFIPIGSSLDPSDMPADTITVLPPVLPGGNSSASNTAAPAGGSSIPILSVIDMSNDYIPKVIDDFGIFVLDEV
jgi:hypothetical protein